MEVYMIKDVYSYCIHLKKPNNGICLKKDITMNKAKQLFNVNTFVNNKHIESNRIIV